jgi:pimeloyl-ACP methyl ester carboxylesterase
MMIIDEFRFKNSSGTELSARIYRKNNDFKSGIIFSHGLFSSKDGYKITRMAESIAESGFVLMTFDFRFSGQNSDRIQDILIMDEVEDLRNAIEYFKSLGVEKLHLMGSSLGAAVTIITASENIHKFESLILIATPIDFSGIFPGINRIDMENFNDNDEFDAMGIPLKYRFIKELFSIDMMSAVQRIKCPALLIHGKMDQVVDFSNLGTYIKNSSFPCSSFIIEDGDHNLTRDSDIKSIAEKVTWWLGKYSI